MLLFDYLKILKEQTMKNRILFIGLLSYIGLFTACGGGGSDSSSQRVDRNEALVQEFNSRGTDKRIYVEIREEVSKNR